MYARWALQLLIILSITACDGPRENAGEKADAAANHAGGVLRQGPQERLGEIQDRTARDRSVAVEATADATEDRADELRAVADQQADALEKQARQIRQSADQAGKSLDRQAADTRPR